MPRRWAEEEEVFLQLVDGFHVWRLDPLQELLGHQIQHPSHSLPQESYYLLLYLPVLQWMSLVMLLSLAGREVTCRDEAAEEEGGGWEVAVDLQEVKENDE